MSLFSSFLSCSCLTLSVYTLSDSVCPVPNSTSISFLTLPVPCLILPFPCLTLLVPWLILSFFHCLTLPVSFLTLSVRCLTVCHYLILPVRLSYLKSYCTVDPYPSAAATGPALGLIYLVVCELSGSISNLGMVSFMLKWVLQ
jgi:hypothetical protein